MKVLHISFSDNYGGANIAAYRTHKCLEKKIVSKMLVFDKKLRKEVNIIKIKNKYKYIYKFKNYFAKFITFLFYSKYNSSFNIFDSNLVDIINRSKFDIIHLHWINNEILSIKDISKIKKKVVWTFHDMWPFCGSEHYSDSERYVNGYKFSNKDIVGIDFPKYIWQLKKYYISKNINVICPSEWIKQKARKSFLFKNNNSYLIRNPVNTDIWKYRKNYCKKKKIIKIIFCGINFLTDERKGFFNIVKSLNKLTKKFNFVLSTIGENDFDTQSIKFKLNNIGYVGNEKDMAKHFSENDFLILPSESDNFPNVGLEALACGLPVVCSENNGLGEVIFNKVNGFVIKNFNISNLNYVLNYFEKKKFDKIKIHNYAKKNFSYKVVSSELIAVYNKILND